jgi:uncharacterized protein YbjT (DUF2867 family)
MRRRVLKWLVVALTLLEISRAFAQDNIIVSGASGQLGSLVIEELLARGVAPANLILVSRTPNTEHLSAYARRGASVRFGDVTQPESLASAYDGGARMLFISVKAGGVSRPELHTRAIAAAARAGVRHIAYTSYVNADRYLSSAIAVDHRRTEQFLEESGVAWTMLRNHIYANGLVDRARGVPYEDRQQPLGDAARAHEFFRHAGDFGEARSRGLDRQARLHPRTIPKKIRNINGPAPRHRGRACLLCTKETSGLRICPYPTASKIPACTFRGNCRRISIWSKRAMAGF